MANTQEGQIVLTNVRGSFLDIFVAKAVNGGEPRFSGNFLLDKTKDAAQIKKIGDEIRRLEAVTFKGKKLPADKVCLRDGDEKEYDGYAGCMFLSAANKRRPTVIDRDKSPLTAEDNKPYPGCYVNAVVNLWAQDSQYGRRINASLEVVQFVKDGPAFGAPRVNLDVLPDLEDGTPDGLDEDI